MSYTYGWPTLAKAARARREARKLSQARLAELGGPAVASVRNIENNHHCTHSFRARTLYALDHALLWESGTAYQLAHGEPIDMTEEQFTQFFETASAAPSDEVVEEFARREQEAAEANSLFAAQNASAFPANQPVVHRSTSPSIGLDRDMYKLSGYLLTALSRIKSDMSLCSITDNAREQRDIEWRINREMNSVTDLLQEIQFCVRPPAEPGEIASALNVLLTHPATESRDTTPMTRTTST